MLRASARRFHGTLSGTTNGVRLISANALSQVMVAHDCGSWFPWTITTTGNDNAQTLNTKSPCPIAKLDWKSKANFSSITLSVPFFSARLIFFNCMLRKLTDSCFVVSLYSILPVLFRISPHECSEHLFVCWVCWACTSDTMVTFTNGLFILMFRVLPINKRTVDANLEEELDSLKRSAQLNLFILPRVSFHHLWWLFLNDERACNEMFQ